MEREKRALFFFMATFILIPFQLSAKNSTDSLKMLLNTKQGITKFEILVQLSDQYINSNLDSNLYYLNLLKDEAVKYKNRKYEAIANTSLGLNSFYNGKHFDAEEYLTQAIELQKQLGDTVNLAHSYNVLAGIYGESGQYQKSINTLFKAIAILEIQGNTKGLITAYNNLGYLYDELDEHEKSIEYYHKAIFTTNQFHHHYNRGFSYNGLGINYKAIGQIDSALFYYRKALEQYKEHQTLNAIPLLFQNIGNIYAFRLGKQDSALVFFNEGIELAKKYDPNSLDYLYSSLAQLYFEQKDYSKSIEGYKKSLEEAEKSEDLSNQMKSHYKIFEIDKITGQLSDAIAHIERYINLKDSINSNDTKISISRLVEKYENDKNKILIQQLKEKQKADQRTKAAMIAGMALLAVSLAFILYALYQRKKRNRLERELLNTEKQKVEEELSYKNKQLVSQALMMLQKNSTLQNLSDSIKETEKQPIEKLAVLRNNLRNQINYALKSEKDWELFKLYFEQVNKTFFQKLKAINPGLTQHDLRLAALIKLRFNIKEAAAVLNLAPNSIKGARSRLRQKLYLENSDDLTGFIENID